mmetsp:Transcript_38971/g.123910  ORF Transcript_38971/g.123910 Transcript_38971/m.123910 type:complete len:267 (+) Transcript_38971:508-1308(+)
MGCGHTISPPAPADGLPASGGTAAGLRQTSCTSALLPMVLALAVRPDALQVSRAQQMPLAPEAAAAWLLRYAWASAGVALGNTLRTMRGASPVQEAEPRTLRTAAASRGCNAEHAATVARPRARRRSRRGRRDHLGMRCWRGWALRAIPTRALGCHVLLIMARLGQGLRRCVCLLEGKRLAGADAESLPAATHGLQALRTIATRLLPTASARTLLATGHTLRGRPDALRVRRAQQMPLAQQATAAMQVQKARACASPPFNHARLNA